MNCSSILKAGVDFSTFTDLLLISTISDVGVLFVVLFETNTLPTAILEIIVLSGIYAPSIESPTNKFVVDIPILLVIGSLYVAVVNPIISTLDLL